MPPATKTDPRATFSWIMWTAHIVVILVIAGLGVWLRDSGQAVDPGPGLGPAATHLLMLGFAASAGLVATLMLMGGASLAARIFPLYQAWFVICLALAEVPTIVGFAATYLGAPLWAFLALVAWSLGLILLAMPSARDRAAWDRLRASIEARQPR
jgi:hypothetical protein